MFVAFVPQLAPGRFDADLDRQCAMRTSQYCELNSIQGSPELPSYPIRPTLGEMD